MGWWHNIFFCVSVSPSPTPEKVSSTMQVVETVECWGLVFGPDWKVVVTSKYRSSPIPFMCKTGKAFLGSALEVEEVGVLVTNCMPSLAWHRDAESAWEFLCLLTEMWGSSTYRTQHPQATFSSSFPLWSRLPTSLTNGLLTGFSVDYQGKMVQTIIPPWWPSPFLSSHQHARLRT